VNKLKSILTLIGRNQALLERTGWFPTKATSPRWWGGLESAEEVIISGLLVQQQTWRTVEQTMDKMKKEGHSTLGTISRLSLPQVEGLIGSSNFYKTKARRLLRIASAFTEAGSLDKPLRLEKRDELLSIEGVGDETADCFLLFAGNQAVVPVSAYVRRVLERVLGRNLSTGEVKSMCDSLLPHDLYSCKLFYAGLSTVGAVYCRKRVPDCQSCILNGSCSFAAWVRNQ